MFQIGQQVVCLGFLGADPTVQYPVKSQVYTIRGFCQQAMDIHQCTYIWLEEILNPVAFGICETAFISVKFRPVKKTSIEIFTTLLTPTPKQKVLT